MNSSFCQDNINFFLSFEIKFIFFSLISGYGFAWVAHFFVEKNKPATFTYPLYSFVADHLMYIEILRGKHRILQAMEIYQIVILTIFFSLVLLEILFTNFFNKNGQRTKDGVVEFFSFFQVLFLAQPLARKFLHLAYRR